MHNLYVVILLGIVCLYVLRFTCIASIYFELHRWCNCKCDRLESAVGPSSNTGRLVQTKDNKIGICCFSARHTSVMSKRKDWLARNGDNVSEWSGFFSLS